MINALITWFSDPAHWSGPTGVPSRFGLHVAICLVSLAIAAAVALPIGIWIGHTRRGERLASNLALFGRALPSLAAIAIVIPFTAALDPQAGFKIYPTVIAMVVLAIPPILVNTFTGIAEVDVDLVESARGMGFRNRDLVRRVELPLALPVIVGGLRSASVQVIATATLGAIYGLSGLGSFVVEGRDQHDDGQLLAGVLLVTLLALVAEGSLAFLQRRLVSPGVRFATR